MIVYNICEDQPPNQEWSQDLKSRKLYLILEYRFKFLIMLIVLLFTAYKVISKTAVDQAQLLLPDII